MFHVKHLKLESRVAAAAPDLPGDTVVALAILVDRLTRADLNVTAIRDPDEAIARHVLDSLRALPLIDAAPPGPLADVGSGGGVPALVIAATRDSRDIHAIEATGRKAAFIAATAEAMGVAVTVHAARSEELAADGSPWRDAFACVCARALAQPSGRRGALRPALPARRAARPVDRRPGRPSRHRDGRRGARRRARAGGAAGTDHAAQAR